VVGTRHVVRFNGKKKYCNFFNFTFFASIKCEGSLALSSSLSLGYQTEKLCIFFFPSMAATTPNHTVTVSGWAAHDTSGKISPYTFKRR